MNPFEEFEEDHIIVPGCVDLLQTQRFQSGVVAKIAINCKNDQTCSKIGQRLLRFWQFGGLP